ncbi:hypothetical protein [Bradyrhizobium sp.]|uniref:hypothetical protein n=1 Tax=Bradyrhizobium sp. TaxID=376 RepID=UPI002620A7A7|nr:hypothetical protein [Bradyrhizobium sp.]
MLTNSRKIYVASSWRNSEQPAVVKALRDAGHEVYDFRNPAPGDQGFSWREIDPDWMNWTIRQYVHKFRRPPADRGFDRDALHWCDTCVLVLPCGRSAHLEAGYAAGQGKRTIFMLSQDKFEPEPMYRLGQGFVANVAELVTALQTQALDCTTIY